MIVIDNERTGHPLVLDAEEELVLKLALSAYLHIILDVEGTLPGWQSGFTDILRNLAKVIGVKTDG